MKSKPAIAVGKCNRAYKYCPENSQDRKHTIGVEWINKEIPRTEFKQDLLYSLGAAMTVCTLKRNNFEERLPKILAGEEDLYVPEEKKTRELSPAKAKENLEDILEQFHEYLNSEEANKHLGIATKEKSEVKELMVKLDSMDKSSKEFTELVLYGLLPYSNTKLAKRVSLFPSFMNIRLFFKEYKYSEEEWNIIAKNIFELCNKFRQDHKQLPGLIKTFTGTKYSRRLQSGSITPILFCLNDEYPLVNNRTLRTYRSISLLLGKKQKLSQKLGNYFSNIKKIDTFVNDLGDAGLKDKLTFDFFCYWYDSEILSEERRLKKQEADESESEEEIEEEIKVEDIDYGQFLEDIDIEAKARYRPPALGDPQRIKINQIIYRCDETSWVLPHFQRYFDWHRINVKEFLESIIRDYYVGSFLLWESDRQPELGIQPILGVKKENDELKPNAIILDGQQRVTSLYYAIRAPKFALRGSKTPLFYYINFYSLLNDDSKQELVEFRAKKIPREESFKKMLFPIFELEKYVEWNNDFEDYLLNQGIENVKARKIGRILEKKLRQFWEGFEIPYIALPEKMELYQVTDIFENINTKGKILSVFDLLIARLYRYDIELKKLWDATLKDFPDIQRYSKSIAKMSIYILQAMSLSFEKSATCKRKDILNIYANVYEKSEREFTEDWDELSEYTNRAIEKLENMRDGFGVKDEKELPFASMIPVLAASLKLIDDCENKAQCNSKLNAWYWSSVFTNAYSSAADGQMTADYKGLKLWFSDDSAVLPSVLQLKKGISNLSFFDIQSKSNAKYKGVMSLIALEGAKDFDTALALENSKNNDKDHLFPRSTKLGFGAKKHINSVLNMTWMSDDTNRKIKRVKKPSLYTKEFIAEKYNQEEDSFLDILSTHFIDEKAYDSLISDEFEEFLNQREANIIGRIKEIIGEQNGDQRSLISSATPFTNKRIFVDLLESCDSYIYWLDKYFSVKGMELITQAVRTEKVKEIKVIMAVEKVDKQFRSIFKDFKKEMANRGTECQLKVLVDSKIKGSIHDRFLTSKYAAYNIPSPDIIARGQLSEISKSQNKEALAEEFKSIWDNCLDIISDWNKLDQIISNQNICP